MGDFYVHTHTHIHIHGNTCAHTCGSENPLLLSIFVAHEVIAEKSIKEGRKEPYFPPQPEKAIKRQLLTVPGSKFV